MKRILLTLALLGIGLPISSRATETLNLDQFAIGITEETYHTLLDSHCYYTELAPDDAVYTSNGVLCDASIVPFANKVVFRAQHLGEMYRLYTGDGKNTMQRYLPDGFYKAKNKYYWVADNEVVRITKNNFYKRILLTVQRNSASSTPISLEDFSLFLANCEAYNNMPIDPACLRRVEQGGLLHQRLARKIVLNVSDGTLSYIPLNSGFGPVRISAAMSFLELTQFSAPVGLQTIEEMYPNNNWQ